MIKNDANEPAFRSFSLSLSENNEPIWWCSCAKMIASILHMEVGSDVAFLCEYLFVRGGCAEETDEDGYIRGDYVGTALG